MSLDSATVFTLGGFVCPACGTKRNFHKVVKLNKDCEEFKELGELNRAAVLGLVCTFCADRNHKKEKITIMNKLLIFAY